MTGPLRGIRVLDLGRYVAAPYCSMILSDLGAEVIRLERPGGDLDRTLGFKAKHGETFTFVGLGRSKKGATLDLHHGAAARDVFGDLVRHSDVLIHNYAPGAATVLGVDYERVSALRSDIVYAAISAFGSEGPDADRTGFDPMAQMASGAAAITGRDGPSGPTRSGVPWVDHSTGLAAAVGILAALRHRDATGEGQVVECALLRTAVSFTAPMIAEAVVGRQERPRLHNQLAYYGPANLYRCSDGGVYIVALSAKMWGSLTRLLARPELAEDPGLATAEERYDRRDELDPLIERWTAERTVAEVTDVLTRHRIPCSVYRTPMQVPSDPQVQANDLLPTVDLGLCDLGEMPVSVTPFRLSAVKPATPTRPPAAGEDNEAVYAGILGYSVERIASLRREGII